MRKATLRLGLAAMTCGAMLLLAGTAAAGSPGVHDGIYLRLGAGVGYLSDSVESEAITVPLLGTDEIKATVSGLTWVGEAAAGGAVSPGLFLGGGLYAHWVPSPTANDAEVYNWEADVDFDSGTLFLVGPFVDYYLDPTQGLHLQASLGVAFGALGDGEIQEPGTGSVDDMSGAGLGALVGFGHEWWVGDQWSLGVLGRFALASFSTEDSNDTDWSHLVISPAVLFTASMN